MPGRAPTEFEPRTLIHQVAALQFQSFVIVCRCYQIDVAGFGIVEVASAQFWQVAGGFKWLQMVQSNCRWLQMDDFSWMWMVSGACIMILLWLI